MVGREFDSMSLYVTAVSTRVRAPPSRNWTFSGLLAKLPYDIIEKKTITKQTNLALRCAFQGHSLQPIFISIMILWYVIF